MLTEVQENIIGDLIIDNGLIYNDAKDIFIYANQNAYMRWTSIIDYCYTLFIECVYTKSNNKVDYVQHRIVDLLSAIVKYRSQYDYNTDEYVVFNSIFDKTSESFSEFMQTL